MARGIPGRRHVADAGRIEALKDLTTEVLEGLGISTAFIYGVLRHQDM